MSNLTDNPSYTPNEVYSIASTDPVEGSAQGASFGGVGVDNYPHQILANRTAWLYGQVNTLNTAVTAIQNKLVKSGVQRSYNLNPGLKLSPNAGLSGLTAQQFVFPSSSPTGAFCLHGLVGMDVSVPNNLSNTVNLGDVQCNLHDDTHGVYAFNCQGYLLTCGNQGLGAQINLGGFFLFSDGYAPGSTVQVSLGAGLSTAAYGFPSVTIGQIILTLTAIPY